MKRITALALLGFTAACSGGGDSPSSGTSDASVDSASGASDASPSPYAAECANDLNPPAMSLKCTGLYTDIVAKVTAPGVRLYKPAVPLWADYASKWRWIYLPPGTKIDATDPNEWSFPVGTKIWKEFSRDNKRVETRLWQKSAPSFWVRATYAWNAAETDAESSAGGDIPWGVDGGTYHIPTPTECDDCHNGRTDHILGFEQVSLGLEGATGLTLSELVAENLISPVPAKTKLTVGDDGTGIAAPPLEWLHINCGTTCHNDNPGSYGYGSSQRLRLDPNMLDGRSSASFPARMTTIGVAAQTPAWVGWTRIVPGDSTNSLLAQLITHRGTQNIVHNQMPPIATDIVDEADSANVIAWISKMPAPPSDAGADAAPTKHVDAGPPDAGVHDAEASEGSVGGADDAGDASPTMMDAMVEEASTSDAPVGTEAGGEDATTPTDAGAEAGAPGDAGDAGIEPESGTVAAED